MLVLIFISEPPKVLAFKSYSAKGLFMHHDSVLSNCFFNEAYEMQFDKGLLKVLVILWKSFVLEARNLTNEI